MSLSLDHSPTPDHSESPETRREAKNALAREVLLNQEATIQNPEGFADLAQKTPRHWVDQIPQGENGAFTVQLPQGNKGAFYQHSRIQHFIGPEGAIVKTNEPEAYTLTCNGVPYEWQNGNDGLSWRDAQGNRLLVGDGTHIQFERKTQATEPNSLPEETEAPNCLRKSVNLPSNDGRSVTFFAHPETLAHPERASKLVLILPGHNLVGNGQVDNALTQGLGPTLTHPKPGVIYAFVDGPLTVAEHQVWMRQPGDFTRFMSEVRSSMQSVLKIKPTRTEIIAHSGAGGVLASAARNNELHADHVTLADASYGSWAQEIASSGVAMTVTAISNSPTSPGAQAVGSYKNIQVKWIDNPQEIDPFQLHMNSLTEAVRLS